MQCSPFSSIKEKNSLFILKSAFFNWQKKDDSELCLKRKVPDQEKKRGYWLAKQETLKQIEKNGNEG